MATGIGRFRPRAVIATLRRGALARSPFSNILRSTLKGRVSWERVVSGLGIKNIYAFLRDVEKIHEPGWLHDRMQAEDPNAVIGECAEDGSSSICFETMKVFAGAYGAEAGNIALKVMATGGIYLGGGIAPKILKTLKNGTFLAGVSRQGPAVAAAAVDSCPRDSRRHLRVAGSGGVRGGAGFGVVGLFRTRCVDSGVIVPMLLLRRRAFSEEASSNAILGRSILPLEIHLVCIRCRLLKFLICLRLFAREARLSSSAEIDFSRRAHLVEIDGSAVQL